MSSSPKSRAQHSLHFITWGTTAIITYNFHSWKNDNNYWFTRWCRWHMNEIINNYNEMMNCFTIQIKLMNWNRYTLLCSSSVIRNLYHHHSYNNHNSVVLGFYGTHRLTDDKYSRMNGWTTACSTLSSMTSYSKLIISLHMKVLHQTQTSTTHSHDETFMCSH